MSLTNFFHRLGSPKPFFEMTGRWLPWLAVATLLTLALGLGWALAFAPPDYQQGHSVRIMYIHVPTVMLAQSAYVMMAAAALVYLVWRIKLADLAMQTIAPFGASMTLLALVTGSLWGKPTWGTWWEWDARTTSTLVLFFLYMGVVALRSALGGGSGHGSGHGSSNQSGTARICAILTLVGLVNLPIIKYSVDWWHTLHQPSSFSMLKAPSMPAEMWLPLLVMMIGMYLCFFTLWILWMRNEILLREQQADWVRQWVAARPSTLSTPPATPATPPATPPSTPSGGEE